MSGKNETKTLAESCQELQRFIEKFFEDRRRFHFIGSAQSVERTIKKSNFANLLSSAYWKMLMGVVGEIIYIYDSTNQQTEFKYLSKSDAVKINSFNKEEITSIIKAYNFVKKITPE